MVGAPKRQGCATQLRYRSGYRRCIEQVIYCKSIDLWRVVRLNGSLFLLLYLNGIRGCLQPFCDFQIHFIYKYLIPPSEALNGLILTFMRCFVRPNSDHFSGGRKQAIIDTLCLVQIVKHQEVSQMKMRNAIIVITSNQWSH